MSRLRVPVSERDHIRGPAGASITLVEYGDYQCPWCGRGYYVLRNLESRYGDDLRFVYRHFPLTQIHHYAMIAAEAAEAAGAQGLFWDMHDMLFQNQTALAPEDLVEYATELGLDVEAFIDDLEGHRYRQRAAEDFMTGVRSGVNATPTLFLDGERWNHPVDETLLSHAIESLRTQPDSEHATP